jgi:hypothetical protein
VSKKNNKIIFINDVVFGKKIALHTSKTLNSSTYIEITSKYTTQFKIIYKNTMCNGKMREQLHKSISHVPIYSYSNIYIYK